MVAGHTAMWTIESNSLLHMAVREKMLANASGFWAGQVENWPGQVEFCMEHNKGTSVFGLQKFSFPLCMAWLVIARLTYRLLVDFNEILDK